MGKLAKLIISVGIAYLAAALGSLFTAPNINGWYASLAKPDFSPPNWLFGPVWSVLYLLIGISLYLVWTAKYEQPKLPVFIVFGVQLGLNVLWSVVFFGLHSLWGGVFVIVALLIAIAANIALAWRVSRPAAYLLVPYLLWVSFATALNTSVALLNNG